MVSTVALAAISESTLSSMHTLSVNGYESGHHRLYSSCGMPVETIERERAGEREIARTLRIRALRIRSEAYPKRAVSNPRRPNWTDRNWLQYAWNCCAQSRCRWSDCPARRPQRWVRSTRSAQSAAWTIHSPAPDTGARRRPGSLSWWSARCRSHRQPSASTDCSAPHWTCWVVERNVLGICHSAAAAAPGWRWRWDGMWWHDDVRMIDWAERVCCLVTCCQLPVVN